MLRNSSRLKEEPVEEVQPARTKKSWTRWLMIVILPAWVYISFILAQLITSLVIEALISVGVPIKGLNENVLSTIISSFIYLLTISIAIYVPALVKRSSVNIRNLGFNRLPSWLDITMAPIGLVIYFIISMILVTLATTFIPWFDVGQSQDTGFSQLFNKYEYVLAFVTLVIIAPIAEEILFRGYLFGRLKKYVPLWVAIVATSLLFGVIHGAWNLAVDTFALSVVLCVLRQTTGSLWAPILLHMSKNSIAFYLLFINPLLFHTLGG